MNRSRYVEKVEPASIISFDQFSIFLSTLPNEEQVKQLEQFIKNNPLIEINKEKKYFTGKAEVVNQIKYLIDKMTNDIEYLESELSIEPSLEESIAYHNVVFANSLDINSENYKQVIKNVLIFKVISSNRFQLLLASDKKDTIHQDGNFSQIRISNRCIDSKKMFVIFENAYEILELQSMIDEELPFNKFQPILHHFEQEDSNKNMVQSQIQNGKWVFFFKRRNQSDWNKFIHTININYQPNDALIMKFKLFPELLDQQIKFNNSIKVIFHEDDLNISTQQISQIQVYVNEEPISSLEKIVIPILETNGKSYRYKGLLIDPVTCFNIHLLEVRKKERFYIQESASPRQFVYFTFYMKIKQVVYDEAGKVELKEKDLVQQIKNKYYRQAIEKIRRNAIINQLPFFTIFQQVKQFQQVEIAELEYINKKSSDLTKLLCYDYFLNLHKFKISFEDMEKYNSLIDSYEKNSQIIFDQDSEIFKKISKLKSDFITRKVKVLDQHRTRGRMEARPHFIRKFVRKCIDEISL